MSFMRGFRCEEVISDEDSEDLLRFINEQPLYKIEMGINPKRGFRHSQAGSLYFVPNFDGDFFPKPLSKLRREVPKKQLMTGTTKFEGLFFGKYHVIDYPQLDFQLPSVLCPGILKESRSSCGGFSKNATTEIVPKMPCS